MGGMELAVESAERLLSGDPGSVTAQDFHRNDQRVLHEVVINHPVTNDGGSVVGTRGE